VVFFSILEISDPSTPNSVSLANVPIASSRAGISESWSWYHAVAVPPDR